MRVGRVLVDDFVEVEEAGLRDSLFAEGLKAIEWRGREEPCCADGHCSWGCGYLGWGVLLEGFR